jgi:hypothetical protein
VSRLLVLVPLVLTASLGDWETDWETDWRLRFPSPSR